MYIPLLLFQRESFVTVKFFDHDISMIYDISELPKSKYEFSRKYLCMRACVCVPVCMCVCVCRARYRPPYVESSKHQQEKKTLFYPLDEST